MKINIFTSDGINWFTNRTKVYPDIELFENVDDPSTVWDVVVVYENLTKTKSCKANNYLYICGEPPYMDYYPKKFLNQFDKVLTANNTIKHPNMVQWQQALPFHVGKSAINRCYSLDFSQLSNIVKPKETKPLSLIASNLSKLPGHKKRLSIVKQLEDSFYPIDFYGRGRNFVDDKIDAINPYLFHICIENTSIPDYWTEKLSDSIACLTVPIYVGCTNIEDYFDSRCMFVANSYDDLTHILDSILVNPEAVYNDKLPFLKVERERLFEKYNIVESIKHCNLNNKTVKTKTLCPRETFFMYEWKRKFLVLLLRLGLLH